MRYGASYKTMMQRHHRGLSGVRARSVPWDWVHRLRARMKGGLKNQTRIQRCCGRAHSQKEGGGDQRAFQASQHAPHHEAQKEGALLAKVLLVGCGRCGGGKEEIGKDLLIQTLDLTTRVEGRLPQELYDISGKKMYKHNARRSRESCTTVAVLGAGSMTDGFFLTG